MAAVKRLVMRPFRAAIGGAGVQVFRPGDVVEADDPNLETIVAAAPEPSGLKEFPLNGAMTTAAEQAIADRLNAVPDDLVEVDLLAQAAAPFVP